MCRCVCFLAEFVCADIMWMRRRGENVRCLSVFHRVTDYICFSTKDSSHTFISISANLNLNIKIAN